MTMSKKRSWNAYPKEVTNFIYENYKGITSNELSLMLIENFGFERTPRQLNSWKKNRNLKSGIDSRFKKGIIPANKGLKQSDYMTPEQIERTKGTRFKKGQVARNYKPVGSERVCSKDGYVLIKVQDEGTWPERWRAKHRVIWEERNGPIPEDSVLMFKDGNKENLDFDNLMLITKAQNAIMNKQSLRVEGDSELTEFGVNLSSLIHEQNKKTK